MTIAASAQDWRSPVDSSMSISRGSGWSETSLAIAISSSVVWPRAESTATTPAPASFAATIRPAARLICSASAADSSSGPASHVSFLQRLIPPPPESIRGPAVPRSVIDLAQRLPLERAVAQLFLFGFNGKDATAPIFSELGRLDLGGVVIDARN